MKSLKDCAKYFQWDQEQAIEPSTKQLTDPASWLVGNDSRPSLVATWLEIMPSGCKEKEAKTVIWEPPWLTHPMTQMTQSTGHVLLAMVQLLMIKIKYLKDTNYIDCMASQNITWLWKLFLAAVTALYFPFVSDWVIVCYFWFCWQRAILGIAGHDNNQEVIFSPNYLVMGRS